MKNVLITGASGFLGKNLLEIINTQNLSDQFNFFTPSSQELDLLDKKSLSSYFDCHNINCIIHAAAICGGIGLNKKRPADLTHLNNKMTINIFDMVREYPVDYFIGLGSVCSYPTFCPVPFTENQIWNGKSEKTNRGYGEAKKMLITELQAHMEQYQTKGLILVPTNMFGFHDHFNDLENNHVIPALINKFEQAIREKQSKVFCWGNGLATRDFIFCSDVCQAILTALQGEISEYEPVNLGSGKDISIKELANLIGALMGFRGEIIFTNEVSNGQPKRLLNISRAKAVLSFQISAELHINLAKTIKWYRQQLNLSA